MGRRELSRPVAFLFGALSGVRPAGRWERPKSGRERPKRPKSEGGMVGRKQ